MFLNIHVFQALEASSQKNRINHISLRGAEVPTDGMSDEGNVDDTDEEPFFPDPGNTSNRSNNRTVSVPHCLQVGVQTHFVPSHSGRGWAQVPTIVSYGSVSIRWILVHMSLLCTLRYGIFKSFS